ncbi:TFIIH basal transcription factor complex, subunit SSL1 [Cordyceps fumosorosea ARSEF 2679]|uniref:General transcription and DNA repair factor IIH n=1 Tax=Cordyceps fumosorosea (strain ARSEF 2679) TaxID=1081104 RepID=A0A167VV36_CORFA|nr:TFIIH basal transcription factor complex, subunit SSL1 [Cordyceps fumosorosea ARSEF 2679]OAA63011.1 TFIIH basal transcription factor complex, subunit SSL1 [Cordyceps fumosorosea ARSEF 2679]
MADSDGEFVADNVSDDMMDHTIEDEDDDDDHYNGSGAGDRPSKSGGASGSGRPKRRKKDGGGGGGKKKKKTSAQAWEQSRRTWETDLPEEGEDGTLDLTTLAAEERRRRLRARDATPLQRGIIRHLVLVLDMSFAMADKDMLPTRHRLALRCAAAFVREFFEQNPISQLAVVGMRDGVAVRISDLGGDPAEHLERLRELEGQDPQGNPSLQNALEMCRGALFHAPSHGTREVLIVYGALLSSDPGDIYDTMTSLVRDRIRVSVIGLSAHLSVCAELCARTNATGDSEASRYYNVATDEVHFRELLLAATTPPPVAPAAVATEEEGAGAASLLMMGFPSRVLAPGGAASYCACHNRPCREGFLCTRCGSRVCRLPAEGPACSLTLILSTHLARSYHHLFPLRNWVEVSWADAARSVACFACQCPFPVPPPSALTVNGEEEEGGGRKTKAPKGVSESARYACEVCGNHFCIDCDVYAHEVIHNCPGCQSNVQQQQEEPAQANGNGNGLSNGHANGAMVVDA